MQQATPDKRKKRNRNQKPNLLNAEPTQLSFWKDIVLPSSQTDNLPEQSGNVTTQSIQTHFLPHKNKLLQVYTINAKKKGFEGQSISTTDTKMTAANQPIFPDISEPKTGPEITARPVRPSFSGQPVRPRFSGQPAGPRVSGQPIRPRFSGQPAGPRVSGQPVRPNISGQPVRPSFSGQPVGPRVSGQPVRPSLPGKSVRPSVPGKPARTFTPIPPANSSQPISQTKTKNPIPPKTTAGQGPKFKPLQEVDKPQFIPIVAKKQQPQPTQQNTANPIITLVGKNPEKKVNTQKKILKFQMQMKSMLEAKNLQEKKIQQVNTSNEIGTTNTYVNPNVGFPNPNQIGFLPQIPLPSQFDIQNLPGMQNPIGIQNLIGVPSPIGVPRPIGTPHPIGVPQPVAGVPPPTLLLNPVLHKVSNPIEIQNTRLQTPAHKVAGLKPKNSFQINAHQNPSNQVSIPLTPLPVLTTPEKPPEPVETVFQIDDERSYTPPMTEEAEPPSQQQLSPGCQHVGVPMTGMSYPAGIPRSFLVGAGKSKGPQWPSHQVNVPKPSEALTVDTEDHGDIQQPYSPSELYADLNPSHEQEYDDLEQQDSSQSGPKRLSAFQRLGPPQPKKSKLTISVTVNDDQEVREVVDESEDQKRNTPVHLREDILNSTDETVKKYLPAWPWKKGVPILKSVTARNSKTVMMLEREQMENVYNKHDLFIQVKVKGYPPSWKKEDVLDALMENIRVHSFIPCFIEFNRQECKFLTLRCRSALLSFHQCGFMIRKQNVELFITISPTGMTLSHLDFVPRLVLRKRLTMCGDKGTVLDLSRFTLQEDISHFIYFPLHRPDNQMEIIEMQNEISWNKITELNLSHNNIASLDGFDLERSAPQLKHLNLAHNRLDKITLLLKCRSLPLNAIHLEGNPLCANYIDPSEYVRVVRLMFSGVKTIDGVPVKLKGDMPKFHRVYCPDDAQPLTDKFLQLYFRLLDENLDHRELMQNMYENNATMTITYNYKLVFSPIYRGFKSLFSNARRLDEGKNNVIKGSPAIIKTITSWPQTEHDPHTFTVDVIQHSDSQTIIRIDGILKLTREALEDDEHLLSFSRTVVLHTKDFVEYKILREMLYWSAPTGDYARSAFCTILVKPKQYPKIDSTTDEDLQGELLKIFMQLTTMNKTISERCLELKKWNLREALEHFTQLWKTDNVDSLMKEVSKN